MNWRLGRPHSRSERFGEEQICCPCCESNVRLSRSFTDGTFPSGSLDTSSWLDTDRCYKTLNIIDKWNYCECAVRAKQMNIHPPSPPLWPVMARVVSRQLLKAKTRVHAGPVHVRLVTSKKAMQHVFVWVYRVFSFENYSIHAVYSIFTFMPFFLLLSEGQAGEPGNIRIKRFSSKCRERWTESSFTSHGGLWNGKSKTYVANAFINQ